MSPHSDADKPAASRRIQLNITSDPDQLAPVRDVGLKTAERIGFGEDEARKIVLALDEALANVIQHGYEGQSGKPIAILMEQVSSGNRAGIRIEIRDEGKQVDPEHICGRDLDDIRPGGLGVYLMNSIMDEVVHSRQDDGMKLEMIKYLTA